MGRKGSKLELIRVNPRDAEGGRKILPCFMEMMAFMTCLKNSNFDSSQCKQVMNTLNVCVDSQAKKTKVRSTLNYHLQRIARQMSR